VDHLIFAVPDLDAGVRYVEELLGVSTEPGGVHQGLGTRNRLVGLGDRSYLEVVSVDPEQEDPERPRWFGLDDLDEPRLATWCCAVSTEGPLAGLPALVRAGRGAGIDLGDTVAGSRETADGSMLRWRMTDPWADRAGGVIPFFIDWGATPHPASTLPAASRFVELRIEHPDAGQIEDWLWFLGVDTPVTQAEAPRIIATLETPNGLVELS
jgi:hypothetical protein